jgi:PPM family protein phosphatase
MDPNADRWKHCLEYAALSDVGLRRTMNQDALAVVPAGSQKAWQRRGHLFMVADGMGAHAAGELASRMAVDAVPLVYQKLGELSPAEALRRALEVANRQIFDRGSASDDFRGMGTTASVLVLLPEGAIVGHCGDSRVYRLRGQKFEQLTFDHSLVWEMSAAGRIPEGELPDYVPRNIITRSLGPDSIVNIDLEGPLAVQTGDTFLLASDGLSGPVRDDEMGTILACLAPEDAARTLVDLANLRGGPDNITVVIVRVTGPQVAENGDRAEPARSPTQYAPVHPLLWAFLGALGLGTAGVLALGHVAVALLGLLTTAVLCLLIIRQRRRPSGGDEDWASRPLGKGPYRTYNCAPDGEFVDRLARIVKQLRDAATIEDWTVDWQQFNRIHSDAHAATFAAQYATAVRLYCHALSFMMAQLRGQPPSHA